MFGREGNPNTPLVDMATASYIGVFGTRELHDCEGLPVGVQCRSDGLFYHLSSTRFSEVIRVLRDLGYEQSRRRGSHYVFRPPGSGPSIMVVKPHGGRSFCSKVDVKRVIELLESMENDRD